MADRPTPRADSDSAADVEVTPAMIEAGFQVLLDSGVIEQPTTADQFVVEMIFNAMVSVPSLRLGARPDRRKVAEPDQ